MTEWYNICDQCEHFVDTNCGIDDNWCNLHFETAYEDDQACDDGFNPIGANE